MKIENWLRIRTSNENALTISEYILSLRREINPSQNYTKMQIQALVELSEYLKQKSFDKLTKDGYRSRPKIMENIPKFKRKEISIYKPTDLWTGEDDLLFLRYCPNKRDR